MTKRRHAVAAGRIFTGARVTSGVVVVDGAPGAMTIAAIDGAPDAALSLETLPPDLVLAPGFIDVQVNGGGGVMLNDAPDASTARIIAEAHRGFGTTGLLATLITDRPATSERLFAAYDDILGVPGVLGVHLEGPHIAIARKGVHRADFIRAPAAHDLVQLAAFGRRGRALVTIAPETVSPASIATLTAAGVRVSIGHSNADAPTMIAAVDAGATGVTHLYNAMSQMTARAPGVVGVALDEKRLFCGLIADGWHVSDAALRLALKAKGPQRLMLVTDAMATAASDVASFDLQGRRIMLAEGRLTAADGTLAGAHLTMIEAVRQMQRRTGAPLADVLAMASGTPAAFLGLGDTHGHLEPGYRADMVAFDPVSWRVHVVWVGGERFAGGGAGGVTTPKETA